LLRTVYRWSFNMLAAICFILLTLILINKPLPYLSFINKDNLGNFKTIFLSIILEAIPFVLLGVLISALLQSFVSERTIQRMIPKNPILGILFACLLGIIFPLCECGMIPVVRRLMHKGMPVYIAVVFILVGPILNPVVYASTFMAFRSRPEMAYTRMGLAFAVAVIMGLILARFLKQSPLRNAVEHTQTEHIAAAHHHDHEADHDHKGHVDHHDHGSHSHDHDHSDHHHHHEHSHGLKNKLSSFLSHASDEFFEMGKYLIFGAALTAIIQVLVSRDSLAAVGQGPVVSHIFMMGFAYVLSLCSTSDAFVASSFATTFTSGSLLAFLVFGPMLDIKSTLMLLSVFKSRFVLKLTALVAIIVFIGSFLFEKWFL
jgi:uncharacterized membrane protein YraQ (UPF0718 family)